MMIYGWDNPYNQIKNEIIQIESEGRVIPTEIIADFTTLDPEKDKHNDAKLYPIFKALLESDNFDMAKNWNYEEPNNLEDIKRLRPEPFQINNLNMSESELKDRFHGAWTGRACGCALGKPVEIVGFNKDCRKKIKDYLISRNAWPLQDYIPGTPKDEDQIELICEKSWKENIKYMEPDDDIHYSLIGLSIIERFGPNFTWRDVANSWNEMLPFSAICTAETQAILNYNTRTNWLNRDQVDISPDFTSRYNNPYREWIGAQIRADGFAYCCAGDPEKAAEFAWRDGHWTHRTNGIYGEMFIAAMIATAFTDNDPINIIKSGLAQIPKTSQLAEAIKKALSWMNNNSNWEAFMETLENEFEDMSPLHTINNAIVCCMAIYYGEMDPDQSISIAVMAGLDTDCNGATVGSITGAASGLKGFGSNYAPKLNDMIIPKVFGFEKIRMKTLSERTFDAWNKVNNSILSY